MSDIKQVLYDIERCAFLPDACGDCSKFTVNRNRCMEELMADAYALLKDPDRIKAIRCKDCRFFEPSNAEEGDNSGYCRNDYAPSQNQTVDAWWFCGSAEKVSE